MCIMNERNKNITMKTIFQLARGFDMTFLEFLDDKECDVWKSSGDPQF